MGASENLKKIAHHYGWESQCTVAIEEMAELQKAICKWRRHGMTWEVETNLMEEIADVLVIVRQLEHLMNAKRIGEIVTEKIDRQLARMEEEY